MASDRVRFNRLLKELLCEKYGGVRQAAQSVGVSHGWLYQVLLHDGRITLDFMEKLRVAFPDRAGELYDAAGIERPASLVPPLAATEFMSRVGRIARARGIPETEVLATLVGEEMAELEGRKEP